MTQKPRIQQRGNAFLLTLLPLLLVGCRPPAPAVPPTVLRIAPTNSTQGVPVQSTIQVDFDQPISQGTLTASAARVVGPAGPISGTWQALNAGRSALFTPAGSLPTSAAIRIELTRAIRGTNGLALDQRVTSIFRTTGPRRLRAGVATVDITPPIGVPLAGYSGGNRRSSIPDLAPNNYHQFMAPSTAIRDRLQAKALVLDDGTDRIALVRVDLIGINQHAVQDVARRILPTTGIAAKDLIVCATHTHSGPGTLSHDMLWQVMTTDIFQKKIYELVINGLVRAIERAASNLVAVRLGIGQGQASGVQKNRRSMPGRYDPTLSVIRIDRTNGNPLAILFNLALHPICLEEDSLEISADWVGVAERTLESLAPGATALFFNAAEGDVRPRDFKVAGMLKTGRSVGGQAHKVWQTIGSFKTKVDIASGMQTLTYPKATLDYGCQKSINAADSRKLPIDVCTVYQSIFGKTLHIQQDVSVLLPLSFSMRAFKIDDTAILCFPGEPVTDTGWMAQARARAIGYRRALVFGLSGGHCGYICTPAEFDRGGYEALLNFYGRQQGVLMIDTLEKILRKIK